MREKFWQWLADIFFYKVHPYQKGYRDWGFYSYKICIDIKWKRVSVCKGVKEIIYNYKHRKEK